MGSGTEDTEPWYVLLEHAVSVDRLDQNKEAEQYHPVSYCIWTQEKSNSRKISDALAPAGGEALPRPAMRLVLPDRLDNLI